MIDCRKCIHTNCEFNILVPKKSCEMYEERSDRVEDLSPKPHIGNIEPMKCNCSDETVNIKNAIQILKIVQNCWADQIPNNEEKISDADAIKQSIRCLEKYLEINERVKNASH